MIILVVIIIILNLPHKVLIRNLLLPGLITVSQTYFKTVYLLSGSLEAIFRKGKCLVYIKMHFSSTSD